MIITGTQVRAVRRKQAGNMLTVKATTQATGISPITCKKVTQGGKVKNIVYARIMNWLVEDY